MNLMTVFWILALIVLTEGAQIAWYVLTSLHLLNIAPRFDRPNASATRRILYIGDSTGCSTGASEARFSLLGRIGTDFPNVSIENRSEGQMRLSRVSKLIRPDDAYDLIIILVGGMDILLCTPLPLLRRSLKRALTLGKQHSRTTILVAPNDTGRAPLYRFPLSGLYHWRAGKVDALYWSVAREQSVEFVSLLKASADPKLFAPDKTHPNDAGYGVWYNLLKEAVATAL